MQVQIRWFYPLVMDFAVLAGLPSLVTWQSRGRGRGLGDQRQRAPFRISGIYTWRFIFFRGSQLTTSALLLAQEGHKFCRGAWVVE